MSSELPYPSDVPSPDEQQLPADPWNPLTVAKGGSPVAVRWAGNLWLHAVSVSGNDEECEILLASGGTMALPRGSIVAVPLRPVFQPGHEVLARWQNAAMFPGTITASSPQGYTVAWHDGDAPLAVPLGALTFLEWCRETQPAFGSADAGEELTPPIIPAPEITAGSWVAIRTRGGYLLAQVIAEEPSVFEVRFTDGAKASVPEADVFPI